MDGWYVLGAAGLDGAAVLKDDRRVEVAAGGLWSWCGRGVVWCV